MYLSIYKNHLFLNIENKKPVEKCKKYNFAFLRNRKIINAVFDGLFFRHFLQKNNSVTKAMQ